MSDYLADVKRYDVGASDETVSKIVKHLGIALRSKDASLVACSDSTELERVVEKWCGKKLGMSEAAGTEIVSKVCDEMSDDRQKQRVTFYYLVAKHAGKLGDL